MLNFNGVLQKWREKLEGMSFEEVSRVDEHKPAFLYRFQSIAYPSVIWLASKIRFKLFMKKEKKISLSCVFQL